MTKEKKRSGGRYWRVIAVLSGLIAFLNVLAFSRGFGDWYKRWIYGLIADCLGVVFGIVPVAVGELLMYLGALAVATGAVLLVLLPFLRKKKGFCKGAALYGKGLLFTVVLLLLLYTLNWIIPFRSSILKVTGAEERGYTLEEVGKVRDRIVEELNACAQEVTRDENGTVIYDREKMTEAVFKAMKAGADEYPLLSGYYPPMKEALCSDFLEWMDIGGYTYPYTMEITWNCYCTDLYYPFLLAHESSHHQGYYQENEANYLAFLSCIRSEDPLIRYAGYNEIYYYIQGAYLETAVELLGGQGAKEDLASRPAVSDLVQQDRREVQRISQEKYEAVSHPAQDLAPAAASAADVGWSVQGDILQENSYDGVIKMVLEYYDVQGIMKE